MITRKDLKAACKQAAAKPGFSAKLSNLWFIVAQRIYPQPARVGPAWTTHYYLVSPTGKQFGGMSTQRDFVNQFGNPYAWQWKDDYRANGFGRTYTDQLEAK